MSAEKYDGSANSNTPPGLSRKGATIAAVIIVLFGLTFLGIGQGMMRTDSQAKEVAQSLIADGQTSVVDDARVNVGRGEDGEWRSGPLELTFTGSDGSIHTLETNHFERFYPGLDSVPGWLTDFPGKGDLLGQEVTYRLGDSPAVELSSELPALAESGRGFVTYLGAAMALMGVAALIGGLVFLIRTRRSSAD